MISKQNQNKKAFKIISLSLTLTCMTALILTQAHAALITVGVTSIKEVKIKPVREAFKALFPNDSIQIVSFKAESKIADQPVSEDSGILGAKNRIADAKRLYSIQNISTTIHYWVSIENFIAPASDEKWVDIGAVVIENVATQEIYTTLSDSVQFDARFATLAQHQTQPDYAFLSTGFSITSGKVIQSEYAKCGIEIDDGNWHAHPDFGGISRADILKKAVFSAVQNLKDHSQ